MRDGIRLVVYTCIAGDYDELMLPLVSELDVDYVCFTNQAFAKSGTWQLRSLPQHASEALLASRYVKMFPHRLFPEYDVSVYVDGNIQVLGGIAKLAEAAVRSGSLAMYRHSFRQEVEREAIECALIGYDWWPRIRKQLQRYRAAGFVDEAGLFEANVMIRRHDDPVSNSAMEFWWHEFVGGVRRDQLSLPFVLWRQRLKVVDLGVSDPRCGRQHFALVGRHKRTPSLAQVFRRKCNRLLLGGLL